MFVSGDPILDILGFLNLAYSIVCYYTVLKNEYHGEYDVFGAHFLCLSGCFNMGAVYLRWEDHAPSDIAITAAILLTGCINFVTAYKVLRSLRLRRPGGIQDRELTLPLHHESRQASSEAASARLMRHAEKDF